jgi:hypothetical protein
VWLLYAGFALILSACDEDDTNDSNDLSNKIVVEAYVYADEPITHVRISKIHDGGSALPVPVNEANVKVKQGTEEFQLMQVDTTPGLYVQADNFASLNGVDDVSLRISYDGRLYTSEATMPQKITGLNITDTLIHVTPGSEETVLSVLSWNPQENVQYALSIRNLDPNAEPIEFLNQDIQNNPFYEISQGHSIELKGGHFRHYGVYQIYVTVVSPEYQMFYNQFSGMSNAPTNIAGGLGIFTAFNGDAVTIEVQ